MFWEERKMTLTRRAWLGATLAVPLAAPALGQAPWPTKPVRVIVPWPPRRIHRRARTAPRRSTCRARLGQPFVIENRPGAGANIGTDRDRQGRSPTATPRAR